MSFGLYAESELKELGQAIARHSEILFIAAAGNGGSDVDLNPVFPAAWAYENLVSVASVDTKDELSTFSNFGKRHVHLAALGEDVQTILSGGERASETGTSFSAPQVTRVAGLILAANPILSPVQVIKILGRNVRPVASLELKLVFGGVLDAEKALKDVRMRKD